VSKIQVLREMWQFMRYHKKYWLAPILIVLLLVGILLLVAKSSVIAPFIYTLF
jgi:competence protein ComGC